MPPAALPTSRIEKLEGILANTGLTASPKRKAMRAHTGKVLFVCNTDRNTHPEGAGFWGRTHRHPVGAGFSLRIKLTHVATAASRAEARSYERRLVL